MTLNRTHGLALFSAKRLAEAEASGVQLYSTFRSKYVALDVKPAPRRRQRDTGPTAATVALVLDRDGCACVRCGRCVRGGVRGADWSVQHRVARGAGGSRRPELNQAGNLLILCGSAVDGCHGTVERRGAADLAAGYWLRQWTDGQPTDPATVPVRHALHGLVLLDNAGGRRPCEVAA